MKLLILGPTGRLGQQLIAQALEQGHEVTAFARSPGKIAQASDRLRVVQGDVLHSQSVDAAAQGKDAVISALGVGESFKSGGLIARSMPNIVRAMENAGIRRFVLTSGVILKLEQVPPILKLVMRLLMTDLMADKRAGEDILRASNLDWTVVYPTRLTNGSKTGQYRHGEVLRLRGIPVISRADVADLILKLLGDPTSIRKEIVASN
jgi:putative NADH-flavin reductase